MKKLAIMLLVGAVLSNSISAYANGTAVIMYGRYVSSIDTSNKIGPTSGTTASGDVAVGVSPEDTAANVSGTDAAAGTTNTVAATDSASQSTSNPKVITSVTGVQGTGSDSNAGSTSGTNAASGAGNTTAGTSTGSKTNATETTASDAVKTVGKIELDKLAVPDNATVLVTLEGAANSDTGTLTLLTKKQNADGTGYWVKLNSCTAKYGKAGLGKTQEGDNKTPVGVFKMNTPFGIKSAEAGFPANYVKVDSANYWNGDSASDLYNKLVSTKTYTDFKTSESEHLINYAPYYNYCIDTGYNAEGTPYKGSAIFLHCVVGSENTHGCIAIPEENMKEVLRNYAEGTTYIAICEG